MNGIQALCSFRATWALEHGSTRVLEQRTKSGWWFLCTRREIVVRFVHWFFFRFQGTFVCSWFLVKIVWRFRCENEKTRKLKDYCGTRESYAAGWTCHGFAFKVVEVSFWKTFEIISFELEARGFKKEEEKHVVFFLITVALHYILFYL